MTSTSLTTCSATTTARSASNASEWRRSLFAVCLLALSCAGCSGAAAPTKDELLSRAKEEFTAGQYERAEKDYREVLRLAQDDPVAVRQLAIIYHNQGQLQAYPLLKKAAELDPEDLEVQLDFGANNVSVGEFQQARDAALLVLEKQPGDEQALLLLANAAVTPADIEETRKRVDDLRQQDQDRPGYHLA
jgi:Flp pilus assembly protein TadD